jgi:hypothetical protein
MRGPNGEEMQAGVTGSSSRVGANGFATAEREHNNSSAQVETSQSWYGFDMTQRRQRRTAVSRTGKRQWIGLKRCVVQLQLRAVCARMTIGRAASRTARYYGAGCRRCGCYPCAVILTG